VVSWKTRPIFRRTASRSLVTSYPATAALPEVGVARVHRILIVVDLPAPFGPRKPNVSPGLTSKSMPRTASISPYLLVSPLTRTAGWPTGDAPPGRLVSPARAGGASAVGLTVTPAASPISV
jgi:hypothetical protein